MDQEMKTAKPSQPLLGEQRPHVKLSDGIRHGTQNVLLTLGCRSQYTLP